MTKDEILRYIILCVSYKHNNDISPYITKSSEEKEDLLFESAIEFLEKLDKENAELKAFRQDCVKLTEDNVVMARQRAEIARKFTKAKEHIENLIDTLECVDGSQVRELKVVKEAERFLKDIVLPKE